MNLETNDQKPNDSVRYEETQKDIEDTKSVSAVILEARDLIELASDSGSKDASEARATFDKMASLIYDLSMRGVTPKKDGPVLDRRLGQLICLTSDFDKKFNIPRRESPESAVARAAIGSYRFGIESTCAPRREPQATASVPTLKRPEKRKISEEVSGDSSAIPDSGPDKKMKDEDKNTGMEHSQSSSATTSTSNLPNLPVARTPPGSLSNSNQIPQFLNSYTSSGASSDLPESNPTLAPHSFEPNPYASNPYALISNPYASIPYGPNPYTSAGLKFNKKSRARGRSAKGGWN